MKLTENTAKKIATILIIILCSFWGIFAILRWCNKNILLDILHIKTEYASILLWDNLGLLYDEESKSINWAKRYPFEEDNESTQEKKEESLANEPNNQLEKTTQDQRILLAKNQKLQSIEDKIQGFEQKIEYYYEDALVGYPRLIEAGTWLEKKLGWGMPLSVSDPEYVFLPNGHVTAKSKQADISEAAENLSAFANWVKEQDMEFLYVQFPSKIPLNDEFKQENAENFGNVNANKLIRTLQENKVNVLDIRNSMPESSEEHYDCFYRTDHHWKLEMGLSVAEAISEKLQLVDETTQKRLWNPTHYIKETYESCYLGSYGRNLTSSMIAPDDLVLWYPNFDTDFHLQCEELEVELSGNFQDTLFDQRKLIKQPTYTLSQYDAFCFGDRGEIKIENNLQPEGKKVLLLKDSFGDVVSPYLALGISELRILDLRSFKGSVRSYLKEYDADIVIVAYNPGTIANTGSIDYKKHDNLWDFR